ncbi:MAG: hypothetical protein ACYDAG_03160 [Chloroflexota bacterium]
MLESAQRLYERAGFHLAEEETHHGFGASLLRRNLGRPGGP